MRPGLWILRSAPAPETRELPAVIKNLLSFAAGMALCVGAAAATVEVVVADGAGKPLADAVVMLEPASGRAPVKPVSGVQITQVRRQFDPQVTVIPVGTAVAFPNLDTVRHHVYSFSGAKTFELKLYAGVPAAPVVFDKAGIAVLGCNIHDQMVAWVVVVDTPFYARSSALGKASIAGVPAGAYRLKVWHSTLADASAPVASALVVGSADVEERATLPTVRRSP
jgi:plastocyanin